MFPKQLVCKGPIYIYIYTYIYRYICPNISVGWFGSKLTYRHCFQHLDSYFCAPVRWFGHFSCVIFCTFVTFLVHFCPQVQQFGHFCNFPAVTFFCAFACCTSIFADRRKGLATFFNFTPVFYNLAIFDPWASHTAAPVGKSGWSTKLPKQ